MTQRLLLLSLVLAAGSAHAADVLTQHNDNQRTGAVLDETVLNVGNVNANQFGLLFSRDVDGQLYAQPLYVSQLPFPDGSVHNTVIVATMHNSVYAYDADDAARRAPFWKLNLGTSVPTSDFYGPSGDIQDEIGILGAPVIDRSAGTLFVVAETKENGGYVHRLHALELTTGRERGGSPVVVQAQVPGTGEGSSNGTLSFDSRMHIQRPALTLSQGRVYVGFASHQDDRPYHGWIFSYDAQTLQPMGVASTTPNSGGGGFWQSSQGFTADENGNVYGVTGNGFNSDATRPNDRTESVIRYQPSAGGFAQADYFTPANWQSLDATDDDLGVGGTVLLPGTPLIITGSKRGNLFVMNRNNLGGLSSGDAQLLQQFQAASGHIHGSPVAWNSPSGLRIYLMGEGDFLKSFQLNGQQFNTTPVSQSLFSAPANSMPGGIPALSASGSAAGSAVLWVSMVANGDANHNTRPGVLRALDAMDLTHELWNSLQNPARDDFGMFAKFTSPTIANGKVFLPTFSGKLAVYGLLPATSPVPTEGPAAGDYHFIASHSGKCLQNASGTTTISQGLCGSGQNQTWTAVVVAHNQYQLVNKANGECLTGPNPNSALASAPCQSGQAPNQVWQALPVADGSFQFQSLQGGQCADVFGEDWTTGATVGEWQCGPQLNQRWLARPVGSSAPITYDLIAAHSGLCVDVSGASLAPGTGIIQWTCHGHANQAWTFVAAGADTWQIVSQNSGQCLAVNQPSPAAGTGLVQSTCLGPQQLEQLWKIQHNADGTVGLVSANSGQCADVSGGSLNWGQGVIQWPCGTQLNQHWTMRAR